MRVGASGTESRSVVMLMYPQVASVDVCGALEAFSVANFLTGHRLYKPMTASVDGAPVAVAGGFCRIEPTCSCKDLPHRIDLLLVAGGPGCHIAAGDERITSWIRKLEPRCARVGSVCTGSTILLASGVVDGQRIATHWLEAMRLKADGSVAAKVDQDAIFVNSGKFWTSAGMLAGVDLALALIEADHGRQLALDVARFMVLVLRRQSGQSQFSAHLSAEITDDTRIRRVQLHIWENPGEDHSLKSLANRAAMSERSLERQFKKVTNTTIFHYIEDVRLSMARRLLETSNLTIRHVALKSGFGAASTLRRAFVRRLGVLPTVYRASFGIGGPLAEGDNLDDSVIRMDLGSVVKGKSAW